MAKRLLWLLAILAVLYIAWTYGRPYFRAWRFRDAMNQQAQLSGSIDREEAKRSLLETAEELGVPIDPRRLTIHRSRDGATSIAATWREIVALEGGPVGRWIDTLDFEFEVSSTRRDRR